MDSNKGTEVSIRNETGKKNNPFLHMDKNRQSAADDPPRRLTASADALLALPFVAYPCEFLTLMRQKEMAK